MLKLRVENKAVMPQCVFCGSPRLVCLDCKTVYRRGREASGFCTNRECRGAGDPLICLTCGKPVTDDEGPLSIGVRKDIDRVPHPYRYPSAQYNTRQLTR